MGLIAAGLVWIVLILASGSGHSSSLASDTSLVPWLVVMVVALLLLGWLISTWCRNMVVLAADREREQAVHDILGRVGAVASDLVLVPVGRELRDYERYRTELASAREHKPRAASPVPRTGPRLTRLRVGPLRVDRQWHECGTHSVRTTCLRLSLPWVSHPRADRRR